MATFAGSILHHNNLCFQQHSNSKTIVSNLGTTTTATKCLRRSFLSSNHFSLTRRSSRNVVSMAYSKDRYSVLQVPRTASREQIKAAYKKLARKYHPDVSKTPGAEEKFKEVAAAYEILSNDEKRSLYDKYGEAAFNEANGESSAYSAGVNPFDIFESIFSETNGIFTGFADMEDGSFNMHKGMHQLGADIRLELSLNFHEAVFGVKKEIEVNHLVTCTKCSGTGAKSSSSIKQCSYCGGRGDIRETQRTAHGIFSQVSTCRRCKGQGEVISDYCRECAGDGRVLHQEEVTINIPPGVNSGDILTVSGEGHAGLKGGPAGNLYIVPKLKEMPGIEREGLNFLSRVSINYTEAILGTHIQVSTVEGFKDLTIPAGTQPGDVLRLKNMGVPKLRDPSKRGDHCFVIQVTIPRHLSDMERKLVQELANCVKSKNSSNVVDDNEAVNAETSKESTARGTTSSSRKDSRFWDFLKQRFKGSGQGSRDKFLSLSIQRQTFSESIHIPAPSLSRDLCKFSSKMLFFILILIFSFHLQYVTRKLKKTRRTH